MLANKYYAFQIRIVNALSWDASHHDHWRLWVQSPEGYTVTQSKKREHGSGEEASPPASLAENLGLLPLRAPKPPAPQRQ
eukprot:symbB.v1.2.028425.t1/scaffold2989.1/size65811/1